MNKTKRISNEITEGVIWKQILIFCFSIMLGTLFQQMYNAVDVMVVGHFVGKEALAAVGGSSAQIINLAVGFFVGLSSGATVIVSRHYGANKLLELKKAIHTAMSLSIIGGIILSIVGIVFTTKLLTIMDTPLEVITESTVYLTIYFSGIIFVFIYNMGSGILRAIGDSKRLLYYLIVCCFINIIMDIILVVIFKMGVAGVAIATLTAQAVSSLLIIRVLMNLDDSYKLKLKEIRFHKEIFTSIIMHWIASRITKYYE